MSNPDTSPLATQPQGTTSSSSTDGKRRPPAHWLIGLLILTMIAAAGFANWWGLRERRLGAVSLTSGEPGFTLEVLPDPTGQLSFDGALARSSEFRPAAINPPRPACLWYRLTIANPADSVRHGILALDNDFVLDATLYQPRSGSPPLIGHSGTTVRWFDRAVPAAKVAFGVDLPAHASSVFYVRVNDPIKQPAHFFLWNDVPTFRHLTEVYKLEYACYFTLWFGLFIYNAFLYAVLRRRDYLLYLIYMICIAAFLCTASEVTTLVAGWPRWPLRGMVAFVLLNLTSFSLVRFSRVFLDTAVQMPRMDPWLRRMGWTVLATSLGTFLWLSPALAAIYESVVVLCNIVVLATLPICGLVLYLHRGRQAGIYVLAFLPLAGAFVYLLESSIGMPDGRNNSMPPLTGSALELVFLALALAWRYRLITDEADRLKAEYTARLESEVAAQTRELRQTNLSLARANQDKDRVFSILGHDLRGPASLLSGLSRLLISAPESMAPGEVATLAAEIEEACQAQVELLDNLLIWGQTQSGHGAATAQITSAADIVESAAQALGQSARRKGIHLTVAVEPGLSILADPKAAETILRNLIGNAVKFTGAGGNIAVRASQIGHQVEFIVSDTGIGIEPSQIGELLAGPVQSQDGTGAEKGTGVGLTLCRDLARANRGDLKIFSELRKGTTATLVLPAGAVA